MHKTLFVLFAAIGLGTTPLLAQAGQKLLPPEGDIDSIFGTSLAVDSDFVIVGAPLTEGGGAAYVYHQVDGIWTLLTTLRPSDANASALFAFSLDLNGEYLLVGAEDNDEQGKDAGAAYVFKREGETWTQQAKLMAEDGFPQQHFGRVVDIDSDYALVASYGPVYLYRREGEAWNLHQTIEPVGLHFALAEGFALIGRVSSVDVYTKAEGPWPRMVTIYPSIPHGIHFRGNAIAIRDDYLVLASLNANVVGKESGTALLFERAGDFWIEVKQITGFDVRSGSNFGYAAALSENHVVISAPNGGNEGKNGGNDFAAVYVYDLHTLVSTEPDEGPTPGSVVLHPNYPNPFTTSTTIRYEHTEPATVHLGVYDLLGRAVRTLVRGPQPAGLQQVQWDGRDDAGEFVANGIYLYRIKRVGGWGTPLVRTEKLILIR